MSALIGARLRATRITACFAVVALGFAPVREARAGESTHACVEAAHEGQTLRDAGKLSAARAMFLECGVATCPEIVRGSCERWASEVDARLPTVVLAVHDESGADLLAVRTSIDGKVIAESIDGRSFPLDPGGHDLLFEAKDRPAVRKFVIVREGEKMRPIAVAMPRTSNEVASRPVQHGAKSERSIAPPIIAGSVFALGVGGFALFGALGQSDKNRLEETCAPSKSCASSEVSSARTKLVVADTSLVVGVAAGIVTGILLVPFLKGDDKKGGPVVAVTPIIGGAFATFEQRY